MTLPGQFGELYIGLMSGTSLDGIDIAIVDFSSQSARILHCETIAYPRAVTEKLRLLNHNPNISFDSLYSADVELGELYAQAVQGALARCEISAEQIVAIGCHGQTLLHSPEGRFPYTVQIGDANILAARTGIDTVTDFRRMDVALGGQGAPLAPLFHDFLFSHAAEHRIVVNIGGIANISYLPPHGESLKGFDTGPGNTLMDHWIARHGTQTYDKNGEWAATGTIQEKLLKAFIENEPYFQAQPPKTTGTEYFSPTWLNQHYIGEYQPQDVQATLCELTALTITTAIHQHFPAVDHCFVCGGGALNHHLMARLSNLLKGCPVDTTGYLGVDPLFVESIGFAWLARQRLYNNPVNLPPVTHAKRAAVIGAIYSASTGQ